MGLVSLQFAGGLAVKEQGLGVAPGVALLYLGFCLQSSACFSIPAELTMGVPCVPLSMFLSVSLFLVRSYKIHLL